MPPAAFTSAQIVDPNGVQLAYDAEGGELEAYTWVSAELDEGAPIGIYTCNTYGLIDLPGCCTWEESQAPTVYNGIDCAEPDAQMKSVMRAEYRTRGLTIPECSVLRDDYSSTYFSMGELNRNGYHTRAWIQDVLLIELDHIRIDFGRALTLSNGYRCPDKNAAVGGVSNSQHQFGKAADIIPVGEALTMDWWNQVATIARNHGADVPNEFDHVHVEWD